MSGKQIPRYVGPEKSHKKDKMSKAEIKNRFDEETASSYSQRNPAWLPEFDFSFSLIQKTVKRFLPREARLLDLGAGTGNLSRTVFEACPDAAIDLLDFSENMLNEAPTVLQDFTGRFKIIKADIFKARLEKGAYDGVVSSFAIHHGRTGHIYADLYKNIYHWLKAPGIFICCDVIAGGNAELSELNERGWRDFLKEQGFESGEVEKILNNYHREDSPLSLKHHLDLLCDAGFNTADILWKKYNFGIYLGIK
jgi:tRNA (cmo5U34)-methyltransferase